MDCAINVAKSTRYLVSQSGFCTLMRIQFYTLSMLCLACASQAEAFDNDGLDAVVVTAFLEDAGGRRQGVAHVDECRDEGDDRQPASAPW